MEDNPITEFDRLLIWIAVVMVAGCIGLMIFGAYKYIDAILIQPDIALRKRDDWIQKDYRRKSIEAKTINDLHAQVHEMPPLLAAPLPDTAKISGKYVVLYEETDSDGKKCQNAQYFNGLHIGSPVEYELHLPKGLVNGFTEQDQNKFIQTPALVVAHRIYNGGRNYEDFVFNSPASERHGRLTYQMSYYFRVWVIDRKTKEITGFKLFMPEAWPSTFRGNLEEKFLELQERQIAEWLEGLYNEHCKIAQCQ
jgi:hypothetical protein